MAIVRVVPKEDWEVIQKYFSEGCGVVLLPEPFLKENCTEAAAKVLIATDGKEISYDFGGDPDFMVDIVVAPYHWAIDNLVTPYHLAIDDFLTGRRDSDE